MDYVGIKSWINSHKKDFANKLISESGAKSDGQKTAIFMAGLPGAGKTEFTKSLIRLSNLNVVRLDMDEIATKIDGYSPEIADRYRAGASALLNKTYDIVVKRGIDFIMDGTFSSKSALFDVRRAISHGYKVKIIYIFQDPKIAWNFTLAREKVEHRAIAIDGFIDSYFKITKNIKDVKIECDKIILDVVVKNKDNIVGDYKEDVSINEIDKIQYNCYNRESLKEYILND